MSLCSVPCNCPAPSSIKALQQSGIFTRELSIALNFCNLFTRYAHGSLIITGKCTTKYGKGPSISRSSYLSLSLCTTNALFPLFLLQSSDPGLQSPLQWRASGRHFWQRQIRSGVEEEEVIISLPNVQGQARPGRKAAFSEIPPFFSSSPIRAPSFILCTAGDVRVVLRTQQPSSSSSSSSCFRIWKENEEREGRKLIQSCIRNGFYKPGQKSRFSRMFAPSSSPWTFHTASAHYTAREKNLPTQSSTLPPWFILATAKRGGRELIRLPKYNRRPSVLLSLLHFLKLLLLLLLLSANNHRLLLSVKSCFSSGHVRPAVLRG